MIGYFLLLVRYLCCHVGWCETEGPMIHHAALLHCLTLANEQTHRLNVGDYRRPCAPATPETSQFVSVLWGMGGRWRDELGYRPSVFLLTRGNSAFSVRPCYQFGRAGLFGPKRGPLTVITQIFTTYTILVQVSTVHNLRSTFLYRIYCKSKVGQYRCHSRTWNLKTMLMWSVYAEDSTHEICYHLH